MPHIHSPDWDNTTERCKVHGMTPLPCTACLAEQHPNVQLEVTGLDRMLLQDPNFQLADFFNHNLRWLLDRQTN